MIDAEFRANIMLDSSNRTDKGLVHFRVWVSSKRLQCLSIAGEVECVADRTVWFPPDILPYQIRPCRLLLPDPKHAHLQLAASMTRLSSVKFPYLDAVLL